MYNCIKNFCSIRFSNIPCLRTLSTTEVSTALRPFYFSVHPDLFGQYPDQRNINENSLKQLSSVIAALQAKKRVNPICLEFFLRDKTNGGSFRLIKIYIKEHDVRGAVLTILKTCDLSTEYVDKLPVQEEARKSVRINRNIDFSKLNENDPLFWQYIMKKKIDEAKDSLKLHKWLSKNHELATCNFEKILPLKEEVDRLSKEITEQWGFAEVRWNCGWNETHQRGCLLSFKAMAEQHPEPLRILRGRVLVFAPFTGVSLDGHIMLNSGEVRHNWLDLIKNVRSYDATLSRIPAFEKSVSQVLRNIKVGRRKFMPKIQAGEYERNLQQITTSLSDYLCTKKFPKEWPDSLKDYEIVVETEAGPLMVSPTGQFIVPSSLPGLLLVNFITTNLKEAEEMSKNYKSDKYTERTLHKTCIETFQLIDLRKDDNVTPRLMIECCEKLLKNRSKIGPSLKGILLNITTYYSVLDDGVVCIPWNFEL